MLLLLRFFAACEPVNIILRPTQFVVLRKSWDEKRLKGREKGRQR